jgi:hypothetical protein
MIPLTSIPLNTIPLNGPRCTYFFTFLSIGSYCQEDMIAMVQVLENARQVLECIICREVPAKDSQVFSCVKHHLICLVCSKRMTQHKQESCPVCRRSFRDTPLTRHLLAEKMISELEVPEFRRQNF